MSTSTTEFEFIDPNNYTFDSDFVAIPSEEPITGEATLALIDDNTYSYEETFDNDAGFDYDSTLAEFSGGQVQQVSTASNDSSLGANFSIDKDANWGNGVLTGTLENGATVANGKLDLTGGGTKRLVYDATGKINAQSGSIKFKYTPDYTGNPPSDINFFELANSDGSNKNKLELFHETSKAIRVNSWSSTGSSIQSNAPFGSITFTQGQEYEIAYSWDFLNGKHEIYIDGVQQGGTAVQTGTRSNNLIDVEFLSIGSENYSDQYYDDVIVYNDVVYTAPYTPGYTVSDYKYLNSNVTLPGIVYLGVGSVQSVDTFTTTESGALKYTYIIVGVGEFYYSSILSAWTFSDGSYEQSNTKAEIVANLTGLDFGQFPGATLRINIHFPDTNIQNNVSILNTDYTGQKYSITPQYLTIGASIYTDKVLSILETVTKPANTEIRYCIYASGTDTWYYAPSGVITESDGTTYAQTSSLADWTTAIETWDPAGGVFITIRAFLSSTDNQETPRLTELSVEYQLRGNPASEVELTNITGYSIADDGSVDVTPVTAYMSVLTTKYKDNITLIKKIVSATPSAIDGFFALNLVDSVNMADPETAYIFTVAGKNYSGIVPNVPTVEFVDVIGL